MITPLDIESKVFKKGPVGYSVSEVDKFLDELIKDYEKIYKENIELKDKMNILNESVQYYRNMESTLQNTLVLAEKTAEEIKTTAYSKSEQVVKEAEMQAAEIIQTAQKDVSKLLQKIDFLSNQFEMAKIKVKQVLVTELEMILNAKIDIKSYELNKEYESDIVKNKPAIKQAEDDIYQNEAAASDEDFE